MADQSLDMRTEGVDLDLLERVNPIFNTAKMTLFQLSLTGDENARALSEALGLTLEGTQGSANTKAATMQVLSSAVMMEARYRLTGQAAWTSGCDVEVDLPCGYTPRAVEFARSGRPYVGLDLPATIAEANPAIRSLLTDEESALVRLRGIDATNLSSLVAATRDVSGSLSITTEGLIMYLTESEVASLADNVCHLLLEHGGVWFTPDPEASVQHMRISRALMSEEEFQRMLANALQKVQDKSDVTIGGNSLLVRHGEDLEAKRRHIKDFLAAHGLDAELVPMYDASCELSSLAALAPEVRERVQAVLEDLKMWRMTARADAGASGVRESHDMETAGLEVHTTIAGNALELELVGRLDTLTSPELLEFLERTTADHTIRRITIDCSRLEYISSAGLRVLLIMSKVTDGGVTLTSLTDDVRHIIGQSNFDVILNIEP